MDRRQRDVRLLHGAVPIGAVHDGPLAGHRLEHDGQRNVEGLEEILIAERHAQEDFVEPADGAVRDEPDLAGCELRLRSGDADVDAVHLQ